MVTMTQRSQAEGMLKNRYGSEDARLNARSILALADSVDALRASLAPRPVRAARVPRLRLAHCARQVRRVRRGEAVVMTRIVTLAALAVATTFILSWLLGCGLAVRDRRRADRACKAWREARR